MGARLFDRKKEKSMVDAENKPVTTETDETKAGETKERKAAEETSKKKKAEIDEAKAERERYFSGAMKLVEPIVSADVPITELTFDFRTISGTDFIRAMDEDRETDGFRLSNRQAIHLFAYAAGKGNGGLDANDIINRMGIQDMVVAVRLARSFFNIAALAGEKRIKS